MICVWSAWCYCFPIISSFIKIKIGFLFFNASLLIRIVLKKEAVKQVFLLMLLWPSSALLSLLLSSYLLIGDSRLETDEREKLVAVIGLHILHYYLFHIVDKKTFKILWELHKKVRLASILLQLLSRNILLIFWKIKQPAFSVWQVTLLVLSAALLSLLASAFSL